MKTDIKKNQIKKNTEKLIALSTLTTEPTSTNERPLTKVKVEAIKTNEKK